MGINCWNENNNYTINISFQLNIFQLFKSIMIIWKWRFTIIKSRSTLRWARAYLFQCVCVLFQLQARTRSRIQSNIVICDTRCVPSYSNISGTKLQCLFRWWNDDCLLCIDGVESVYRMCRYQYCQYCHIGIISVQYSKHSIIRGHHLHTHGTIHFLYWIWHHCWL